MQHAWLWLCLLNPCHTASVGCCAVWWARSSVLRGSRASGTPTSSCCGLAAAYAWLDLLSSGVGRRCCLSRRRLCRQGWWGHVLLWL